MDDKHFVYVWIASTDHVLHAAVVNNGDGTLTATYESPYPGDYLVHIQDVCTDMSVVGRGKKRPWERAKAIVDSPFKLTISGEIAVDVDDLPLCDAEHPQEDEEDTFWRTGSWISSKFASAKHGVLRDGWVFQPKTCVHDTFSYDDLMLLATGLKEPTWLLILGTSVQRGVFLTLVDMVLAQGQKSDFATSAIQKCWGFAEIRVGNLRLTYQVTAGSIELSRDVSWCILGAFELLHSSSAPCPRSNLFFSWTLSGKSHTPTRPTNVIDPPDLFPLVRFPPAGPTVTRGRTSAGRLRRLSRRQASYKQRRRFRGRSEALPQEKCFRGRQAVAFGDHGPTVHGRQRRSCKSPNHGTQSNFWSARSTVGKEKIEVASILILAATCSSMNLMASMIPTADFNDRSSWTRFLRLGTARSS